MKVVRYSLCVFAAISFYAYPSIGSVVIGASASNPNEFAEYTGNGDGGPGCSVIVARVVAARAFTAEETEKSYGGTHMVTLEPQALLAGLLDPSTHQKLDVSIWVSDAPGMMISAAPHAGDLVLAVIMLNDRKIEEGPCDFMPGRSGLVVLDGAADKRVHETLERIRTMRAAAKAEAEAAEKRAETQPSPEPDPPISDKPKSAVPEKQNGNGKSVSTR